MALIFITGSGRRLGRQLALKFAQNGWDIAIHYNSSEDKALQTKNEIIGMGRKSNSFKADLRNESEIKSAIQNCIDSLGFPEVLINNAAIFPNPLPLIEQGIDNWDNIMSINLRSTFVVSKFFAELIPNASRIINMGDMGAFESWRHHVPYNISKAGVIQLTKALAKEYAPRIQVNAVSPGAIFIEDEPAENISVVDPSKIPMKRYGNPDDIFSAVNFFATCSRFITGQNLVVDGGYKLVR